MRDDEAKRVWRIWRLVLRYPQARVGPRQDLVVQRVRHPSAIVVPMADAPGH